MGKKYFKEHIEDKDEVRVKKYIHCVRCCVMVEWLQINKHKRFQPLIQVNFNRVLEDLKPFMPDRLFNSIQRLVAKKRESDKDTIGPRYRVLDQFIESILDLDQENKMIPNQFFMIYKIILFLLGYLYFVLIKIIRIMAKLTIQRKENPRNRVSDRFIERTLDMNRENKWISNQFFKLLSILGYFLIIFYFYQEFN